MFSVLVIRLRSLRLLRVSGIVMRLRMFLLLITFLKASHSFRNRLLVICRSEERFSRNAETDLVCRLLLEKKKRVSLLYPPSLPPPPQRARPSGGPQPLRDDRLRRPDEHRRGITAS